MFGVKGRLGYLGQSNKVIKHTGMRTGFEEG